MIYRYTTISPAGAVVEGRGAFDNLREVEAHLRERALEPVEIRPDLLRSLLPASKIKQITTASLVDCFSYLSSLLNMGMEMSKTLEIIRETLDDPIVKEAMVQIADDIDKGHSLSSAMTRTKRFPSAALSSIEAGEAAGQLEHVFGTLAQHFREINVLKNNAKKAAMYPLISLCVLMAIGLMILVLVVPQLEDIFPPNPPLPTKIMLFMSTFLRTSWWMVLLVGAGLWWGKGRIPARAMSAIWERVYKLPVLGPLTKQLALANLFMNLAMLSAGGVAIMEALATTTVTASSELLAAKLRQTCERIEKGASLSEAFTDPFFPPIVISSIKQGETTGLLDQYFERLAVFLKDRVNARIATVSTFIEPVIILLGGGLVMMLALAIFMPIYGQLGNIGK